MWNCYPEEAVGGNGRPQAALDTRRELVPPANSNVIVTVTGLLPVNQNQKFFTFGVFQLLIFLNG